MQTDKPTVSVCMITYNHEPYIQEAIDGIFMQQADFDIELLISNDNSKDGTHQKILNSTIELPAHITLSYFNQDQNLGMIPNFTYALQQCKGRYIALCEGDDYWTDPLKLQKQVDFLERNRVYSGIGTNSMMLYENTGKTSFFNKEKKNRVFTLDDFLRQRKFHTASFLFRNQIQFPADFTKVLSGDRLLFLLVAIQGKLKYLTDVTCVYRKNAGGISSRVTSSLMIKDLYFIKILKDALNQKQLKKLKTFIYKTILTYSHSISFKHYIYISSLLLFNLRFNYTSKKIVSKSFRKIKL